MHYVVTLVHGTFARDAAWTQEYSLLRIALEERLDAPVKFRCVTWSGRNAVEARMEGARRLVEELRSQMQDSDAVLFVIAHSHGGNLAMYAMRDPAIRSRVAGLVTMATPFVVASRRLSMHWDARFLWAGFGVYAAALTYLLQRYITPHLPFSSALAVTATAVLCFAMLLALAGFLLAYLENHSDILEETLELPVIDESQLLIIRSAGDEASIALLFSQFLALVPYRLFVAGATFVERLHAKGWTSRMFEAIATLITGVVVGPFMVAAWVSQIAMNADLRGNNPFLDITAEATPPGQWRVHLFVKNKIEIPHAATVTIRAQQLNLGRRDPADGLFESSTLLHSHLYMHWEALRYIGDWIVARKQNNERCSNVQRASAAAALPQGDRI